MDGPDAWATPQALYWKSGAESPEPPEDGMPLYQYRCRQCGRESEILVRHVGGSDNEPACPGCGATALERVPAGFAYHRSLRSRLDQMDPKYDKMIDASNGDLSFDNLRKKYRLDRPATSKSGE